MVWKTCGYLQLIFVGCRCQEKEPRFSVSEIESGGVVVMAQRFSQVLGVISAAGLLGALAMVCTLVVTVIA